MYLCFFPEVLSGQNPSQTIVPCCVHIECGDRKEGKCVNTPASGVGNCKGELKVSVLHTPLGKIYICLHIYIYRSNQLKSAKFFFFNCQGRSSMPRGEVQNHVLHTLPRRYANRVHKRIYDSGGSGDPSIPRRAPP